MTDASPEDPLTRLLTAARNRAGLSLSRQNRDHTLSQIKRVMRRLGIDDLDTFANQVDEDDDAFDDLMAELTIGETYFFRDPGQFELVRDELIPQVQKSRSKRHHLRAWSAGCASGEEAYSLAMLFLDCGLEDRFTVLGTDICRVSLGRARRAEYRAWSLRGGFQDVLAKHLRNADDGCRLDDELRHRVSFEYLNLAHDSYPSFATETWGMDLILCRNVLIYFEAKVIADVAARFFQCLSPGGVLIPGPSDPMLADFAPFEVELTKSGIIYRRPMSIASVAPATESELQRQTPATRTGQESTVPKRAFSARSAFRGIPPEKSSVDRRTEFPQHDVEPATEIRPEQPEPAQSDHAPSAVQDARDLIAEGAYDRVVEMLKDDSSIEATVLRVRALANIDLETAESNCVLGLDVHPLCEELQYLHGVLLLELGRLTEATAAIRRVLFLEPDLVIAHFTQGTISSRAGNASAATRAFRNAHRLASAMPTDEVVRFSDGELAGHLADNAHQQLRLLAPTRQ